MDIKLYLEEISQDRSAYKIHCKFEYIITNMCRDKDFEPEDIKASVKIGEKVNGSYGYVSKLGTFNTQNKAPVNMEIDGHPKELLDDFNEDIDMKVEGDSELGWILEFSIWNKFGVDTDDDNQWFNVFIERYTQKINLTVENLTKENLSFDLVYIDNHKKSPTLLANRTVLHAEIGKKNFSPRLEIYPRDIVKLFLYKKAEVLQ